VVEALASGTFVIGTPMALEFLPEKVRRRLLTASTADEFATGIEKYLKNPAAFDENLNEAVSFVQNEYQWSNKVKELENLCYQSVVPFVAAEV
jgi:glycosyltransferase involved in cell wall biosynthesis